MPLPQLCLNFVPSYAPICINSAPTMFRQITDLPSPIHVFEFGFVLRWGFVFWASEYSRVRVRENFRVRDRTRGLGQDYVESFAQSLPPVSSPGRFLSSPRWQIGNLSKYRCDKTQGIVGA